MPSILDSWLPCTERSYYRRLWDRWIYLWYLSTARHGNVHPRTTIGPPPLSLSLSVFSPNNSVFMRIAACCWFPLDVKWRTVLCRQHYGKHYIYTPDKFYYWNIPSLLSGLPSQVIAIHITHVMFSYYLYYLLILNKQAGFSSISRTIPRSCPTLS